MAQKKFSNMDEYSQLYPEYRFVFVGDNGQGDVRAAELMMRDARIGSLQYSALASHNTFLADTISIL